MNPQPPQQVTIDDLLRMDQARFEGPVNAADCARLEGQIRRIFNLMRDGIWRTLKEIEVITGDPQASISAQLRHMKKLRFGAHTVDKRKRGGEKGSQWEYQLIPRIWPCA
jgi:hypothetical protein